MRVFVALALLVPGLLSAQEPPRRSWFTTIGDVWATRDGWVEWRVVRPGGPLARHDPYPGTKAYFAPAAARTWVAAARRALADTSGGSSAGAVARLRGGRAEIALTVHHDRARDPYDLQASSCNGSRGSSPTHSELLLLVDALEEAARVAAASRPTPAAAPEGAGPFSASEVTCPAAQRVAYMPAWSPDHGRRPDDRGEAIVRFVVAAEGNVDLATLVWDRVPAPRAERAARAALAAWGYDPASLRGRPARQWSHATIWFADSTDAVEWQLAGRVRTESFVARRDGRVEHAFVRGSHDSIRMPVESRRLREAYPPAVVRAWLESRSSGASPELDLAVPAGLVLTGGRFAWYRGCAALPRTSIGRRSDSAWSQRVDSVRAAIAEAERIPLVPIDTTRTHGETEATCPARPRGDLAPALRNTPGEHEAVISFVVERDGWVNPASVALLGELDADAASSIRAALAAQAWEPGRLAGVRVPQRAHLVLFPRAEAPSDLATTSCAQAGTAAVQLRVREPAAGVPSADLARVAHGMSSLLDRQALPPATEGTLAVVVDDVGGLHYFTWLRAPADTVGRRHVDFAFTSGAAIYDRGAIATRTVVTPLAVEASLREGCR